MSRATPIGCVYVMDFDAEQGEIIERGDHDALLAQNGRYHELYTGKTELD